MNPHRFVIYNGACRAVFLTASTRKWAEVKVAAFSFDKSIDLWIFDTESVPEGTLMSEVFAERFPGVVTT
jgi:hypothetical protein